MDTADCSVHELFGMKLRRMDGVLLPLIKVKAFLMELFGICK